MHMQSENFTPAADSFADAFDISWEDSVHGFSGPVQSSYPVFQFPSIGKNLLIWHASDLHNRCTYSNPENFFRGWNSIGVPTPKDPGSGDARGAFWAPSSLDPKDETRSYARTAHYDRVIGQRPNYHLLTETAVSKIRFEGKKAVGVEYLSRSNQTTNIVKIGKEVILAAGAIHSPQILQLSGIGGDDLLRSFGIKTIVNLPGVGKNFQDHPTLYSVFNCE
jgi:choline dehydrogenase